MYLLYYLLTVSVVAVTMTVCDKSFAKHNKRRISENALMCIASLGGSVAMLVTMLTIRHKTKHIKFMAGIPLIIVLQVIFSMFLINAVS